MYFRCTSDAFQLIFCFDFHTTGVYPASDITYPNANLCFVCGGWQNHYI